MDAVLVRPRRHELLAIERSAQKEQRDRGAAERDDRIDQESNADTVRKISVAECNPRYWPQVDRPAGDLKHVDDGASKARARGVENRNRPIP